MATALQIVKSLYPNVTEIKDAKRAMKIEVTKQDSQSRAVKDHKECALAQACKRRADGAVVCLTMAYIVKGNKATRYKLPGTASREITAFDRNAVFQPGIYSLSAIPPSARLGLNKQSRGHGTAKKKLNYHRTENIRELLHG